MPTANGAALVGSSWSLGVRATRFVLRWGVFGIATYWRHWWRLLKADNLTDPGMIRRRRAWLLAWTPATLLLFAALLPGVGLLLARTIGLFPLLAAAVLAVVSTLAMRRQGRVARKPQPPVAASVAPALELGEWSDVNPRTQAAERAIGDLLWRLSENGWSPADALTVVAGMPPFSQTVVLWCCESNLARFSEAGGAGSLDTAAMGPALWFFDFTSRLRAWLGGGPTLAVAEPAMRSGR